VWGVKNYGYKEVRVRVRVRVEFVSKCLYSLCMVLCILWQRFKRVHIYSVDATTVGIA
jgi:hypothetical protein